MNNKIIAVDIDGVLTTKTELNDYGKLSFEELKKQYASVKPNTKIITLINNLAENNNIIIYTSRNDYFHNLTVKWLKKHNVRYHHIIFNKPYFHYIIDDRALFIPGLRRNEE